MRLILLRHPETTANTRELIYGATDYPYTTLGEKQVKVVVKHVQTFPITKIITSPLGRAKKLAEAIGEELGILPVMEKAIEEMHYGILEGYNYKEAKKKFVDIYNALLLEDMDYEVEGGESYNAFMGRVHEFLDGLIQQHKDLDDVVLIVTHGGVIRTALEYLMDGAIGFSWSMNVENGVMIDLLQEDDRFIINNLLNIEENEL